MTGEKEMDCFASLAMTKPLCLCRCLSPSLRADIVGVAIHVVVLKPNGTTEKCFAFLFFKNFLITALIFGLQL